MQRLFSVPSLPPDSGKCYWLSKQPILGEFFCKQTIFANGTRRRSRIYALLSSPCHLEEKEETASLDLDKLSRPGAKQGIVEIKIVVLDEVKTHMSALNVPSVDFKWVEDETPNIPKFPIFGPNSRKK